MESGDGVEGGVTFVFDRVMHYHISMLRSVEQQLALAGVPMRVLSALDAKGSVGRVPTRDKAVERHDYFRLTERLVGGYQLRYQHGLIRRLNAENPKVVVSMCHSGTLSEWSMLCWARKRRIRTVAWQCGYEYNPGLIKRVALSRFMPLFDFHLCYHTNAQKYAVRHGARLEQTLVMHNTIDEGRIVPGDAARAKSELTARFPLLLNKKVVLYVGAVLEEKRLESIFAALALLGRTDTMFVLVGDGPHLPVLKARYTTRTDWISVGNLVQGVGAFFDAADVFVLPGTGGLAINEAMAHRLPVVSGYADGSADDLVLDGATGFRLREGTPQELAAKVAALLDDPKLARRMGERGEAAVRGELSFKRFVDRVVGVLVQQHKIAKETE